MNSTGSNTDAGSQNDTAPDLSEEHVTLEELLRETTVTAKTENIDENRQVTSEQITKERETVRIGREKYYGLRDKWSWFIAIFIGFMLLFQLFLTIAIGYKWVDFSKYKTFLHLVMGENFAQILGMGYIVAKYLFPQGKN